MIPQPIIDRWAHESGVFSARPDAPVVPDEPGRRRWRRRFALEWRKLTVPSPAGPRSRATRQRC